MFQEIPEIDTASIDVPLFTDYAQDLGGWPGVAVLVIGGYVFLKSLSNVRRQRGAW